MSQPNKLFDPNKTYSMTDFSLILKYIIDYGNAGLLPNQDGSGGEVYKAAVRIKEDLEGVYEGISKNCEPLPAVRFSQPERKNHG